jgi:hypothetical protein
VSQARWAPEEERPLEEVAGAKLREDAARSRQHWRGTSGLPLDPEQARRQLGEETRALRSSRPRNRRWRALEKLDAEVDGLQQRQVDAISRLQEAEQALSQAPDDDARSLAKWLAAGEQGERPSATVYERERERDAARLLVEAVAVELDRALERRVDYVARHRERMLKDARKAVEEARGRLLEKVSELPALRQALLDARETVIWAAAFPGAVEHYGFPSATALGLMEPVRRATGSTSRIEYAAIIALLEEDAGTLAEAFSRAQKEQLGIPEPRTPLKEALWDSDPANVAWKREELERARRLAEWHPNPAEVAAEVREQRP